MFVSNFHEYSTRAIKSYDFFIVGFAAFLWPFWRFKPLEFDGDASFIWYFHESFYRGMKYGSDIVITAGPWSILNYSVFHPETYLLVLSMQLIISLLLAMALLRLINLIDIKVEYRCLLAIIIVAALSLSVDARSLVYMALVPVIYESLNKEKISFFFLIYIVFAAFVGLSKGTFTILVPAILLITVLLEHRSKYQFVYSSTLLLFCLLAGWFANHSPYDLLSFVYSILMVSEAYSQVFSEEGNLIFYVFYLFATFVALMIIVRTESEKKNSKIKFLLIMSGYAFIFLALIKTGFIRQDGEHVVRSVLALPIIFSSYIIVNIISPKSSGFVKKSKVLLPRGAVIFGLAVIIFSTSLALLSYRSVFYGKIDRLIEQWLGLQDVVFNNAELTKFKYTSTKYQFQENDFPKKRYTLMVNFITPILKSGITEFDVVPGVTSYMNSGDYISSKNAMFLSQYGAQNLLYQGSFLAPLSTAFISLNANYMYSGETLNNFSFYKRRKEEIDYTIKCADKLVFKWGEEVSVPKGSADYTFVKVLFKRSIFDKILGVIFKPIPVFFKKSISNNELKFEESFPIEEKLAAAGVIISASDAWKKKMPENNAKRLLKASSISIIAGRGGPSIKNIWNPHFFLKKKPMIQFCQLNFKDD